MPPRNHDTKLILEYTYKKPTKEQKKRLEKVYDLIFTKLFDYLKK